MRKLLVQLLKSKGITDANVLNAIGEIPRHLFLDSTFVNHAYEDKPFPIGSGQTISQPYTVAFQSQLLEVRKRDKVLEIGTGSGYQACVLLELGATVFSIERQKNLYQRTRLLLPGMGYNPKLFFGDGYKGLPSFAPFDRIIITAAAPFIPEPLIEQLKPGGIMVVPLGAGNTQTMTTLHKIDETAYVLKEHGDFRFVPLLGDKAAD